MGEGAGRSTETEDGSKFVITAMTNGVREEKIATLFYAQPLTTVRELMTKAEIFMIAEEPMHGQKGGEGKAKPELSIRDQKKAEPLNIPKKSQERPPPNRSPLPCPKSFIRLGAPPTKILMQVRCEGFL